MPQTSTIEGVVFMSLAQHTDSRGWLIELFRHDEIDEQVYPQMAYISQTQPGVARGPHEHVDQTDYFAFVGPGDFKLYLWDARDDSSTQGTKEVVVVGESNMQGVIIPPGVVHAYQCISEQPGWVFNCPNRLYAGPGRAHPVDEVRHEDRHDNPYQLDEI